MVGCFIVLVAILVFGIYLIGTVVVTDIVLLVLFLCSLSSYLEARKMQPSAMKCPNCGSRNVKISSAEQSRQTSIRHYRGAAHAETLIKHKRVATCLDCGFPYDYITQEDIDEKAGISMGATVVTGVLLAMCAIFTIVLFGGN